MTQKPTITTEDLRALIADRKNDPVLDDLKNIDPDFLSNPDNKDRIRIRKREQRINRATKTQDMDFS